MSRRIFSEYQENVQERMGNRSEATAARVSQWLNDALIRVASQFEHVQLQELVEFTLEGDSDSVIPPAPANEDIWWIDFFRNTRTGMNLIPDSKENIEALGTKPTRDVQRFYRWKTALYFDAKAPQDSLLRCWYVKKPEEWASGSSPLDSMFDPIIEIYAALQGFNLVRDFAQAHICEVQANNYISEGHLPVRQNKLNDYQDRIRPRTRR